MGVGDNVKAVGGYRIERKYKDLSDNEKLVYDSIKSGKIKIDGSMSMRGMVDIMCGKDNKSVRNTLSEWMRWEKDKTHKII